MAFQNEEDYLDNLLKSITENKDSASSEELLSTDSKMQIPDTFETSGQEDKEDDSVYQQMLFDEVNPMAAMFENNMAQAWQDVTVGDVLGESDVPLEDSCEDVPNENNESGQDDASGQENTHVQKNIPEQGGTLKQEAIPEPTEEEMVDDYIRKVLNTPDEEPTEYIDLTNTDFSHENDLIGKLDGIINTVESGIQEEAAFAENENEDLKEQPQEEEKIDFSGIEVDDELKELLGVEKPEGLENIQSDEEALSEEELKKLDEMVSDEEDTKMPMSEDNLNLENDDDDMGGLTDLLEQAADVGISLNEDDITDAGMEEDMQEDMKEDAALAHDDTELAENNDNADMGALASKGEKDKKKPKEGFLARIFGKFKKKNQGASNEEINENQQVLDELFDENGELLGDKKKVKKKGLFSKSKKSTPQTAEAPTDKTMGSGEGLELEDIPELTEKEKDKKKKEKKKKEPKEKKVKEKKPKTPKKPKEKKEKVPVNPSELIQLKPIVIIIMLIIIAGVTGYTYFFITSFSYNQALDEATYYLVDKKYTFAYEAIAGIETKNEEDVALKEQICTIMYVQKQYNSYERYAKMNMPFEAIDSLIKGLKEYDTYYDKAVEIGVSADLDNVKSQIVNTLQQQYGITETMARSYGAITDYEQYVYILESYGGISK